MSDTRPWPLTAAVNKMEGARKVVNLSHSFQRFTSRQFHRSAVKRWRLCGCCMQLPRESLDLRYENYDKVFRRSIEHPQDYWAEQAEHIVWDKKWTKVLDNSKPPFTRWYASQFKFWCFLKLFDFLAFILNALVICNHGPPSPGECWG